VGLRPETEAGELPEMAEVLPMPLPCDPAAQPRKLRGPTYSIVQATDCPCGQINILKCLFPGDSLIVVLHKVDELFKESVRNVFFVFYVLIVFFCMILLELRLV